MRVTADRILRDLQVFSDGGTTPRRREEGRREMFIWTQDDIRYVLSRTKGQPDAELTLKNRANRNRNLAKGTYRQILRTPLFFDFQRASERTARGMAPVQVEGLEADDPDNLEDTTVHRPDVAAPRYFVPPTGTVLSDVNVEEGVDLYQALRSSLTRYDTLEDGRTKVILIKAPAGLGKTSLLRQLAFERATHNSRVAAENKTPLFLYADMQGRRLQYTDDVFASALNTQRWEITTDRLPVLVRNGIVIPIVDGFDELLGTQDDDNDFQEFDNWLGNIRGGHVIISARNAYAERKIERLFERVGNPEDAEIRTWDLIRIEVALWNNNLIGQFAHQFLDQSVELDSVAIQDFFSNLESESPIRTPFFVSEICKLAKPREGADASGDTTADLLTTSNSTALLSRLTRALLRREAEEKLLDPNRRPITTIDTLTTFCSEAAYLCWDSEDGNVPLDLLKAAFPDLESMSEANQRRVERRIPDFALFSRSRQGRFQFLHELFRDYFIAEDFYREFVGDVDRARKQLRRKPISPSAILNVVDLIRDREEITEIDSLRRFLQFAEDASNFTETSNISNFVSTILEGLDFVGNLHFSYLEIYGPRKFAPLEFRDCVFDSVSFNAVDLSGVDFGQSQGQIVLNDVLLRPAGGPLGTTLSPRCEPLISGLRFSSGGDALVETYNHGEIQALIRKCYLEYDPGQDDQTTIPYDEDAQFLVSRLRKVFSKTSEFGLDDQFKRLDQYHQWPKFRTVLLETGMCVETESENGHPMLKREFLPEHLDAAWNDAPTALTRAFWNRLILEFPADE